MRRTPAISLQEVTAILTKNGCNMNEVNILAIRGYYLDSEGVVGKNDRRIYDDAMCVLHPVRGVLSYQANTDPNGYRKGWGTGAHKGMACLKTGVWRFGTGRHRGRLAFRQCCPFTVTRDGNPDYDETGYHAINLHDGGIATTSSAGCQTLPAATWPEFRPLVYTWLDDARNGKLKNDWGELVRSFDYVLIDETERRKGNVVVPRWDA